MTIFGYDLSRYDAASDVRPEFDLLNVEDPGCSEKAHLAHALGITWGLYSWVYPGDQGHSATRSKAMGDLLDLDGIGQPPAGHWLDYEQEGVTPQDLVNAFAAGVPHLGVYTYLYIIGSVAGTIGDHPLWLAYYPGNNDGQYPAGQIGDALRWGAKLWQYSSTNGTLDRDVVVDEAWWSAWVGSAPAPPPDDYGDEDTMLIWKRGTSDLAVLIGNHPPRKIASINDYQKGTFLVCDADVFEKLFQEQLDLYRAAVAVPVPGGGTVPDSGLTQEEIVAISTIVRTELDKTKLGGTP